VATQAQPSDVVGRRMMIMVGTVHIFDENRGFGFIRISFKEQYFFHVSNWGGPEAPLQGQKVEFDLGAGHKPDQRPQAVKVIPSIEGGAR
jgi:cold shock CspA family protein